MGNPNERSPQGKAAVRTFSDPADVRNFPKGRVELVRLGEETVGRAVLEPGWKWSTCVKDIAGTDSCQASHLGYQVSGTLHVRMDDGTEFDCRPGEVSVIPPGHDAWVVGSEPVVSVDFQGLAEYAVKRQAR